ncbi:hypothetical protein [Streptomyces chartreusis]
MIGVAIAVARRRPLTALGLFALLGRSGAGWVVLTPDAAVRLRPTPSSAHSRSAPCTTPGPPLGDGDCRCYRASAELRVSVDHFRLRFDNSGRLAAKGVIQRASPSQHPSMDAEFVR